MKMRRLGVCAPRSRCGSPDGQDPRMWWYLVVRRRLRHASGGSGSFQPGAEVRAQTHSEARRCEDPGGARSPRRPDPALSRISDSRAPRRCERVTWGPRGVQCCGPAHGHRRWLACPCPDRAWPVTVSRGAGSLPPSWRPGPGPARGSLLPPRWRMVPRRFAPGDRWTDPEFLFLSLSSMVPRRLGQCVAPGR